MDKLKPFLLGVLVGAAGLYGAMTYHVVRADDGLHVVRKVSCGLGGAYVDIRNFTAAQWNEHRQVALALVYADKEELLHESAVSQLRDTVRDALETLGLR